MKSLYWLLLVVSANICSSEPDDRVMSDDYTYQYDKYDKSIIQVDSSGNYVQTIGYVARRVDQEVLSCVELRDGLNHQQRSGWIIRPEGCAQLSIPLTQFLNRYQLYSLHTISPRGKRVVLSTIDQCSGRHDMVIICTEKESKIQAGNYHTGRFFSDDIIALEGRRDQSSSTLFLARCTNTALEKIVHAPCLKSCRINGSIIQILEPERLSIVDLDQGVIIGSYLSHVEQAGTSVLLDITDHVQ